MRDPKEIKSKCVELYEKHLKEMLDAYLSKVPDNCFYNKSYRVKSNGMVGFCGCAEKVAESKHFVFVCNDEDTAHKCKHFKCKNAAAKVQEEFETIIRNPSHCGQKFPKLAVLIWCLQETQPSAAIASTTNRNFSTLAKRLFGTARNLVLLRWFKRDNG